MNWKHIFPQLQNTRSEELYFKSSRSFLSAEECQSVVEMTHTSNKERSYISWGNAEKSERDTDLYWLYPDEKNYWLFEKVADTVGQINNDHYKFDLDGTFGSFQIGRYEMNQGYDWHCDLGAVAPRRKLSVSIQLSGHNDYQGGRVQFFGTEKEHAEADIARGSITVFPSWALHRVTKVSDGVRWSLVTWLEGTPFR